MNLRQPQLLCTTLLAPADKSLPLHVWSKV